MSTSGKTKSSPSRQLPFVLSIACFIIAINLDEFYAMIILMVAGFVLAGLSIAFARRTGQALGTPKLAIGQLIQTSTEQGKPVWGLGAILFLAMGLIALLVWLSDTKALMMLTNAFIGIGLAPAFLIPVYPRFGKVFAFWFALLFTTAAVVTGVDAFRGPQNADTTDAVAGTHTATDESSQQVKGEQQPSEPVVDPRVWMTKRLAFGLLLLMGGVLPLIGLTLRFLKVTPEAKTYLFDEGFYTQRGFVAWSEVQGWQIERRSSPPAITFECQGTQFSATLTDDQVSEVEAYISARIAAQSDASSSNASSAAT